LSKKYAKASKDELDVFKLGKSYEQDKFQETFIDDEGAPEKKEFKFPWENFKP